MGAFTSYFVDPVDGNDSTGDGSIGTPWKTVQNALDTITRDSTNGDKINIKSSGSDVLSAALSLTSYGTPGVAAPLMFEGYDSSEEDGGTGILDGDGSNSIFANVGIGNLIFKNMRLTNSGSAVNGIILCSGQCKFINCEADGADNDGIHTGGLALITNCYIHNIGGNGVSIVAGEVSFNYFTNNGSNVFTNALHIDGGIYVQGVYGNIFSLSGVSNGLNGDKSENLTVAHNSFFTTGTGDAIIFSGSSQTSSGWDHFSINNNLIEGFNTGISIEDDPDGSLLVVMGNAVYNSSTEYSLSDVLLTDDNEILSDSPFSKSGADTLANRATYFAVKDVGNVLSPLGGMTYVKGAVQSIVSGETSEEVINSIMPAHVSLTPKGF